MVFELLQILSKFTLPETNIAPENRPSKKETSVGTIQFSGATLVSGRVLRYFALVAFAILTRSSLRRCCRKGSLL